MVYQYSTRMLRFLRLECKMQSSHPRVVNLRKQIYIHHLTFFLDLTRFSSSCQDECKQRKMSFERKSSCHNPISKLPS